MMRKGGLICTLLMFIVSLAAVSLFFADNAWAEPEFSYSGQFRINSYTDSRSDTGTFGDDSVSGARLRWRPVFNVKVSDTVSMHTQFNIGHINSNFFNARKDNGGDPAFALRHAVLQAQILDNVTGVAGLVPLPDKFGDTLFSADWDFNPLAVAFIIGVGEGSSIRVATGKFYEGSEMNSEGSKDDFDAYVLDFDSGPFGASVYYGVTQKDFSSGELALTIYGARYNGDIGGIKVNAFVLGSIFDQKTADFKSNGYAAKLEAKIPVGEMTLGLLGIYGSGDGKFGQKGKTAGSFVTFMSLVGSHGYYGYTGKLNIQGATDTGIDDPVNIDGGSYSNVNLGRGLTTIQANLNIPVNGRFSAYLAAGWFQSSDAPSGFSKDIGTDLMAMGTLNLGESLNFQFGVDYAALGEGSNMTVEKETSRNITTVFSRLQLEY